MTLALGIDGGASSMRWRLEQTDSTVVAHGTSAPITGHLFSAQTQAAAGASIMALAAAVLRHGRPDAVVAGVTGLSTDSEPARLLQQVLARAFDMPPEQVMVYDDLRIGYLGAFAPGGGILVYAGTGSIAYHLTKGLNVERCGGHGFLIDDAGGGFWIGQQALRAMMRRRDQRHGTSPLDAALLAAIGGTDWAHIREFAYGGGRQAVASLARVVAEAAKHGDSEAARLLSQAGAELARLCQGLMNRLGPLPVALAGGVARSPLLAHGLQQALGAGAEMRVVSAEPVETAARLARAA